MTCIIKRRSVQTLECTLLMWADALVQSKKPEKIVVHHIGGVLSDDNTDEQCRNQG